MNVSTMTDKVYEKLVLSPAAPSKTVVEKVLRTAVAEIGAALVQGGDVDLYHVGRLYVKNRAARQARNLQTGATIEVPETRVVGFKQSTVLKRQLNTDAA